MIIYRSLEFYFLTLCHAFSVRLCVSLNCRFKYWLKVAAIIVVYVFLIFPFSEQKLHLMPLVLERSGDSKTCYCNNSLNSFSGFEHIQNHCHLFMWLLQSFRTSLILTWQSLLLRFLFCCVSCCERFIISLF